VSRAREPWPATVAPDLVERIRAERAFGKSSVKSPVI
jgi:hypothetical protein